MEEILRELKIDPKDPKALEQLAGIVWEVKEWKKDHNSVWNKLPKEYRQVYLEKYKEVQEEKRCL